MKQITTLLLLTIGGFLAWRIGETLSSDAISMGLGIFFGMLAGIPASLLVLAAARRRDYVDEDAPARRPVEAANPYANQPPVIVLAGMGGMPQQHLLGNGSQLPAGMMMPGMQPAMESSAWSLPRSTREYRIVGERDEAVEEW
ncbi:MAG: hypothetical protein ACRC1H_12280 [Caldilineaceae bacterium]